jgi:hypothetical protein
LHFGASAGTTMCAGMPRSLAASASAAAWLPLLCVATPRAAVPSSSSATALQAPRNLNAPPFWKTSHLKWSERPATRSMDAHVNTGVTLAWPAMRAAAARTSSMVAA